VTPGPRCLG